MNVSTTNFPAKTNYHSDSVGGSAAIAKSPEKEDKARALDIGFSEKVAQLPSENSEQTLAQKAVKAPPSGLICSLITCGCAAR